MCDSDYINIYRIQIQRIRDRKRTLREPLFATSVKLALLQFGGPVGLKIPTIPKIKSIFPPKKKKKKRNQKRRNCNSHPLLLAQIPRVRTRRHRSCGDRV